MARFCIILVALTVGCTEFPTRPVVATPDSGNPLPGDTGDGDTGVEDTGDDARDLPDTSDDAGNPGCMSDPECNDGTWCNGIETCVDGACVRGPEPRPTDNNPCTDDRCAECADDDEDCVPGLEGRTISTPTGECDCEADEDCEADLCGTASCIDGTCHVQIEADGVVCSVACDTGPVLGSCREGECALPTEGPHQSPICSNGMDDDCDGQIDSGPGCSVATQVMLEATADRGSAGLEQSGLRLRVEPRVNNERMPGQLPNLYCTARRVQYEQNFDSFSALAEDGSVAILNGRGGAEAGVDRAGGGRGLLICDGARATLGPFRRVSADHGLRVSMTVDLPANQQQLPPDTHRLIVSYRTDQTFSTMGSTWIAVGAWALTPLNTGSVRLDFLVVPPPDAQDVWVRIDEWSRVVDQQARSCFMVDDVVISTSRIADAHSTRHRPLWDGIGARSEARESFDGRSIDEALAWPRVGAGQHFFAVNSELALSGSHSLGWLFHDATFSAVFAPIFVSTPQTFERRAPLVAEFAADGYGVTEAQHRIVGFGVGSAQIPTHRYAAAPDSQELDWVDGIRTFSAENRSDALHRIVLPEAAKVFVGLDLFWSSQRIEDPEGGVLIDDVDVFLHADQILDIVVEPLSSQLPYPYNLRAELPGTYDVTCHWQTPGLGAFPTISSEPVRVYLD